MVVDGKEAVLMRCGHWQWIGLLAVVFTAGAATRPALAAQPGDDPFAQFPGGSANNVQVPVRLPGLPVTTGYVSSLEARVAELETRSLDAQKEAKEKEKKDAGYVVGSDKGLIGKFTNDGAGFASKNGDFK